MLRNPEECFKDCLGMIWNAKECKAMLKNAKECKEKKGIVKELLRNPIQKTEES